MTFIFWRQLQIETTTKRYNNNTAKTMRASGVSHSEMIELPRFTPSLHTAPCETKAAKVICASGMLGSQKQIIMVIWTLSSVWWISSSTSWKNKARAIEGTAKVCFSTNQEMVVTWGVEISQGAMLRACPSRIASAKSLEKEKNLNRCPAYSSMFIVRVILREGDQC